MGIFSRFFSRHSDDPEILPAIERAVMQVDPNLARGYGYPARYREAVTHALEYARSLAESLPGPVTLNRKSFAADPLVHAIFPDPDAIDEALRESHAMIDFRRSHPGSPEIYALMGMRRMEKNLMGYELSGDMLQADAIRKVVYFTTHTIESPARSEARSRHLVAMRFFDSLVASVVRKTALRRQAMSELSRRKDLISAKLRLASPEARETLEKSLMEVVLEMQQSAEGLDVRHHIEDFETVLFNPEQYLGLDRTALNIDGMGIQLDGKPGDNAIVFNDLLGFDRRRWTVTMVRCTDVDDSGPAKGAYPRRLSL